MQTHSEQAFPILNLGAGSCHSICLATRAILPHRPRMIWFGGKRPTAAAINASGTASMPGFVGIEFVDAGDDWFSMRMPVDRRTRQPQGRLHGGASVVLAETIGSIAANCCIDPSRWLAVGMEINANHIRPAYDGWVTATARPEALGRTSHVWSIRIEDEAGKLVCISRFTVAVIPVERK
ncbi:MAG: hotdog fold thioesterase [Novosphingobium sp.]|nr:hotdog fold thioesterase [Novosphingobium sp.]